MATLERKKKDVVKDTKEIANEVVANIAKMEISEDKDETILAESAYSESSDEKKPDDEKEDEVAKAFANIGADFTGDRQPILMYIFDGWYERLVRSTPEELLPELKEFKGNFRDFANQVWQVLTKPIADDVNSLLDDMPACKTPEDVPDGIWRLKMAFSTIQKDMMIAEKGFYKIADFIENLNVLPEYLVPKELSRKNPSIKNAVIEKFTDLCVLMKTMRRRTLADIIRLAVPYGVDKKNYVFVNSLCKYYLLSDLTRVFIYKDDDADDDYTAYQVDTYTEDDIILEMQSDIPEDEDAESESESYPLEGIFKKARNSASGNEAYIERTVDEWQEDKYDRIWDDFLESGNECTLSFRKNKDRKMMLKMAKEVDRIAKKYGVNSYLVIAGEHAFSCNASNNKYTKKALKAFTKEHDS